MGVTGRRARLRDRASGDERPHEIVVEVDRLVIVGIESLDRDVLGRAIETELGGLLAGVDRGGWGAGTAVDRLRASADIGPVAAGQSWSVGSRIADSVHEAMTDALRVGSSPRPLR